MSAGCGVTEQPLQSTWSIALPPKSSLILAPGSCGSDLAFFRVSRMWSGQISSFNALETLLYHWAPRREFLAATVLWSRTELLCLWAPLRFHTPADFWDLQSSSWGTEMSVETTGMRMFPKRIKAPKASWFPDTGHWLASCGQGVMSSFGGSCLISTPGRANQESRSRRYQREMWTPPEI